MFSLAYLLVSQETLGAPASRAVSRSQRFQRNSKVCLSLSLSLSLCVCMCVYVCVDYIALIHSIRPLQAKQLSNTGDVPFTTTLETIVK